VCLTTQLSRGGAPDPAALYSALRAANPAPYAAWLRVGDGALQLCCCSPERFLRGDRGGTLEAKPIKGTAPRCADPAQDAAAAAALAGAQHPCAYPLDAACSPCVAACQNDS
jgi:para-aminobenzoate synthetase